MGASGAEARFDGADLYYARPGNANFAGAVFRDALVQRAIFRRANLASADFTGAEGQANFENANLTGMRR